VHPLWKSLVLPAGGVVLCWLLLMTLWLPLLDYARSYRSVVEKLKPHLGDAASSCVAVSGAGTSLVASLEVFAPRRYDARPDAANTSGCEAWIQVLKKPKASLPETLPGGWLLRARVTRPTDRDEQIGVYRKALP
jgi:hypothetical protein